MAILGSTTRSSILARWSISVLDLSEILARATSGPTSFKSHDYERSTVLELIGQLAARRIPDSELSQGKYRLVQSGVTAGSISVAFEEGDVADATAALEESEGLDDLRALGSERIANLQQVLLEVLEGLDLADQQRWDWHTHADVGVI